MREEELRQPVHEFLENRKYSVFDEIPLFSRKIDIIAKRRAEIIAVELKLQNWRKAIHQAYHNQRVANYSYIALPETIRSRANRIIFREIFNYGIGLLSVDGTVIQIIPPERSSRIQPNLRRNFIRRLQLS